jgi:hypothetical protein
MTIYKRLLATAAAAAMLTGTTAAAAANPAASLSLAPTRAATPAANQSGIGAEVPTSTLISIGVLAILVVLVLVVTGNDDDSPDSP